MPCRVSPGSYAGERSPKTRWQPSTQVCDRSRLRYARQAVSMLDPKKLSISAKSCGMAAAELLYRLIYVKTELWAISSRRSVHSRSNITRRVGEIVLVASLAISSYRNSSGASFSRSTSYMFMSRPDAAVFPAAIRICSFSRARLAVFRAENSQHECDSRPGHMGAAHEASEKVLTGYPSTEQPSLP